MNHSFALQVRIRIGTLCDGLLPEGLILEIEGYRITLSGCVEDAAMADAIAAVAASTPGARGLHNRLRTRVRVYRESVGVQPAINDVLANPADRPIGEIDHIVWRVRG